MFFSLLTVIYLIFHTWLQARWWNKTSVCVNCRQQFISSLFMNGYTCAERTADLHKMKIEDLCQPHDKRPHIFPILWPPTLTLYTLSIQYISQVHQFPRPKMSLTPPLHSDDLHSSFVLQQLIPAWAYRLERHVYTAGTFMGLGLLVHASPKLPFTRTFMGPSLVPAPG